MRDACAKFLTLAILLSVITAASENLLAEGPGDQAVKKGEEATKKQDWK